MSLNDKCSACPLAGTDRPCPAVDWIWPEVAPHARYCHLAETDPGSWGPIIVDKANMPRPEPLVETGPREEPELPSMFTQAVNFAASMAAHAASGFAVATDEQRAERLAICAGGCEWFRGSDYRCAKCGCGISAKVEVASSVCPVGKW